MKKRILVSVCFALAALLLIAYASVVRLKKEYESARYAATLSDNLPDNYNELVGATYGESDYAVTLDGIKVDIERIVSESYYIKYSWVNYDKSYVGINFFVEDLSGSPLEEDEKATAVVKVGKTSYMPFYSQLSPYPEDQPLGYKKTLFARYYPFDKKPKKIDIDVYYNGKVYMLKDIPVK